MKLVINRCFGGFSLSRAAVARMAELQGRPCFFFLSRLGALYGYDPAPPPGEGRDLWWVAFDIPNPNEVLRAGKGWHEMTRDERIAANALHETHVIETQPKDRTDPMLVRVVEELGDAASGGCAELAVIEIPDGVQYVIDEYDGLETIHALHRSWP